jgi:predicted metal-dependent hydrolase
MSTEAQQISVNGLPVQVVRKAIKNLHLGVYPPRGRVRVAAPLALTDEAIRLAVIGKLGWIKRHRARFEAQPRQTQRGMVSGESHFYLGRRYRLRVIAADGPAKVVLRNRTTMELHVSQDASTKQRERVLQHWYRRQLKELIPPLLHKWQQLLGVQVTYWGIKKMKTRWGTCNTEARRIWLNLELAKKPVQCLEYLVVHELMHLHERHHNVRFVTLVNQHLPTWRHYRQILNSEPLAHENWSY